MRGCSTLFSANFQRQDTLTDSRSLERGLVGDGAMGMMLVVESGVVESEVETLGGGAFSAWRRKPYQMEVGLWKIGWQLRHWMSQLNE